MLFFFFKQKTAYELRISDWSSDVCSSDLFSRFSKTFQHMVVGASLRKINRPMQINAPAHAPTLAARDQLHPPARAPALSLAAPASSRGPGPDVGRPPAA